LNLGNGKGEGETEGSVINHVGFIVDNWTEITEYWL